MVLVRGDLAFAEPRAEALAREIGACWGVEPRHLLRPESLPKIVADLRTLSLFEPGKLIVAIDTGLFADRDAAADLLKPVLKDPTFDLDANDLTGAARSRALRLLQVVRLHGIDPAASTAEAVLAQLPDRLLAGPRASKEKLAGVRSDLEPLLSAAVAAGLHGAAEADASLVADLVHDGLPDRHLLVLVETAVSDSHPLLRTLDGRGALVETERLQAAKGGGFTGIQELVRRLEEETGSRIQPDAARELARRTLRVEDDPAAPQGAIDDDSAARLEAELRKLVGLAGGRPIDRALVEEQVEDRGREAVWPILDELGAGRPRQALEKISRRFASTDDPLRERLVLFALLAGHARLLVAVGGALQATGARRGVTSYGLFQKQVAKQLQGAIAGVEKNPLAGLHAYRLHKIYLHASRFPPERLAALPALTLETERRLKGDSADPEAALTSYVVALSAVRPAPRRHAGSRARGRGGGRS